MNLTFGIMTIYDDIDRLRQVVDSIRSLNIPNYEIIIAGSYDKFDSDVVPDLNCRHILCDGWLPRKKNLVAKTANNDILVLTHDYYLFDPEWYEGYCRFGDKWDICSNPQYLLNGKRHFTDWVLWDHPTLPRYHSLHYEDWSQTKYQYVSGGYFLVKRNFLRDNPISEAMPPGSPEDVEWSLRVRSKAAIVCNPLSTVRHNKAHRDNGRTGFPYEQ
jgi:hypothetical protein